MSHNQQPPYGQHPYGQQPQQYQYVQPHPGIQNQGQGQPFQQQSQQHAYTPAQHQLQQFQPAQQQPQPAPQQHQQQPSRFAHLADLPMYLLSNPAAATAAAHAHQQSLAYRQELLGYMTPEPQLSAMDRATLMALEVTTGATFFSPDKAVNAIFKGSHLLAKLDDISARNSEIMTLTRWSLPPESGLERLVVDVLEHKSLNMKWVGGNIVVKASRPVEVRVRGKWVADLRKGEKKGWTKSFNKKSVDGMGLVMGKGEDVGLEMVVRMERAVTGLEMTPIYEGFWKEWVVPGSS
ncbi:hypothetical protein B0T14DRAFT_526743 [Immersiella caudata]|uniref:Uncharacterized protein n=1 Tax=Immersiella caudata TaxID=314043 RepID=A0AA40BU39_9PEZI|nr:hypothetical protein B0T14DRAFT_526743 [Immersiella caudata]